MIKKKDSLIFLIFSTGFMFSVAGTRPIVPLFSSSLGADNTIIGLLIAVFSFIPLFLSIYFGKNINRIGIRISLLTSLTLATVGLLWPFIQSSLPGIFISQLLTGISQVTFVISMQTYAGIANSKKKREKYVMLFSIGIALGSFLGPFIGGVIGQYFGYPLAFLSLGATLIILFPLIFFIQNKKRPKTAVDNSNKTIELIKISRLRQAFLLSTLVLLGKDVYLNFFPLLAQSKGIPPSLIGLIISINSGAGILIRFLLPVILAQGKRDIIIRGTLIIIGISYIMASIIEHIPFLFIISFILGLCVGVGQPLTITKTINALPNDRIGEGLGLRVSINRLTQILYPTVLGFLSNFIGLAGVFSLTGISVILASVKYKEALLLFKRKKR